MLAVCSFKKESKQKILYPVLVGETPDPSSHLHGEDEEQEEEELMKKEVWFNTAEEPS